MYEKQETVKTPASQSHQKYQNKWKVSIIAACIIAVAIVSSITIAFLIDETAPAQNTLVPASVACAVEEDFDGKIKENVSIKNTGEVQSYIRAMVVVTWMSADQSMVTASKPQINTDYTITYTEGTAWLLGSDGYWYYTLPVDVGNATETLISSCSLADSAAVPEGFYLSVEVVGSAIQSTPTQAVTEKWSSGVSSVSDGSLVIKQGGAES